MLIERKFQIVVGGTRIVFLAGDCAIKIPKPKTLKLAQLACNIFIARFKTSQTAFRPIHVHSAGHNIFKSLTDKNASGLEANKRELRRWKRTESDLAAAIRYSFFWSFVIIQDRVNPNEKPPKGILVFASRIGNGGPTDNRPPNRFILPDGRIGWLDYAGPQCPLD